MYRRNILLVLISLICASFANVIAQPINQEEINEGIDSYITGYKESTSFNGNENEWLKSTKRIISYNSNNQKNEFYQMEYIDGLPMNNIKYEYSYGANNQVSSVQIYYWLIGVWNLVENRIYNYGAQGKLTEYIVQQQLEQLKNKSRVSIAYNSEGTVTEYINQVWGDFDWINKSRYVYIYDSKNMLTELRSDIWTNETWKPYTKEVYKYDGSGKLIEKEVQTSKDDNWFSVSKEVNEYDKWGRSTGIRGYNWSGDDWINSYRHIITYINQFYVDKYRTMLWSTEQLSFYDYKTTEYKYNASSNLIETIVKTHDGSALTNSINTKLNYDEENNFVSFEKYKWQSNNWTRDIKYTYSYKVADINDGDINLSVNALSFPNPFTESTTIKFNVEKTAPVTLRVFDINGRNVAQLENKILTSGEYNYKFSANDLRSGTYFYQLSIGDKSVCNPIVITSK